MPKPVLTARLHLIPLAIALPLLLAASCGSPIRIGLPTSDDRIPVSISLGAGVDPEAVVVLLDDAEVTDAFAAGGPGLVGSIPVPPPGLHQIKVTKPIGGMPLFTTSVTFQSPAAAPAVLAVEPAGPLPSGAWLRFRLAAPAPPQSLVGFGFAIECDGQRVNRVAHARADGTLLLNPSPALPPGAACRATWRGVGGEVEEATFDVAAAASIGAPATVLYDRSSPVSIAPFPDDYWLDDDASTETGSRVAMPDPPFANSLKRTAFTALATLARDADGWSRQTPIVLHLTHPLDPSLVPASPTESQDPFAAVSLIDVDPQSPAFGQRVPYRMLVRTDPRPPTVGGGVNHSVILFPTLDLREQGRYAVVFTRRAFASGEPGRGFGPAPLFSAAVADPEPGEAHEVARVRAVIGGVLATVASLPDVPIPTEDVALALSVSVRTHPAIDDLIRIKEQALAAPAPELVIPDVTTDPCPNPNSFCIQLSPSRAAIVRGFVRLPRYRDTSGFLLRDPVTGEPRSQGVDEVPFVMSLPRAALDGPVFPVMYQHGNPGQPSELLGGNSEQIDDAGFALLGFRDALNRELCAGTPPPSTEQCISTQVLTIFATLLGAGRLPEPWTQTAADQMHFLRLIQSLASLDLIHEDANGNPALGPDGQPEIDPSTILYKGISEGANNAQRFLPFAPEILAAEATVGGARLGETLIHQSADEILTQVTAIMNDLEPVELWVGLSLFQAAFDPQDGHTYLRHLYREPLLPFAGSSDVTPPSTLWTEGIGDSLVPNNASRAMVRELGIPHVRPVAVALPGVEEVDAPLAGNVAPGITAGYFQFDPATTPGCLAINQPEGHYCPQSGAEPKAQRLHFLLSAIEGEAEIVDPL